MATIAANHAKTGFKPSKPPVELDWLRKVGELRAHAQHCMKCRLQKREPARRRALFVEGREATIFAMNLERIAKFCLENF